MATALKLREVALSERDFYTKRFENGQQRGLVVLSTSAGVVALLGAIRALLPESEQVLHWLSILFLVLSIVAFGGAAVLALIATGPVSSKKGYARPSGDAPKLERGGEVDFVVRATNDLLEQVQGIRTTGNRQARRVVLAIQCEAVAVILLAATVLVMVGDEAGWLKL